MQDEGEAQLITEESALEERNGMLWALVVILPVCAALAFVFLRPQISCADHLRSLDDTALATARADFGAAGELGMQALRGSCKDRLLGEMDLEAPFDLAKHGATFDRYQNCLDLGLGLGTLGKKALDLIR
jgi:hypothetical protein